MNSPSHTGDVLTLNETAALLWKQMEGKEFTLDDLIDYMRSIFDVPEEEIKNDLEVFIDDWIAKQIILV